MECQICRFGRVEAGHATVTLDGSGCVVVFRNIPAQICENCGEVYLDEEVSRELFRRLGEAAKTGVVVQVMEFQTAAVS